MLCPRCGQDNPLRARFCEECGTALRRPCAHCGSSLSAGAKFCPECGQAAGIDQPSPSSSRFTSPDAYTPRHLAEKMLTGRGAIEGERKQVTVLFADLKGSMELLAVSGCVKGRKYGGEFVQGVGYEEDKGLVAAPCDLRCGISERRFIWIGVLRDVVIGALLLPDECLDIRGIARPDPLHEIVEELECGEGLFGAPVDRNDGEALTR